MCNRRLAVIASLLLFVVTSARAFGADEAANESVQSEDAQAQAGMVGKYLSYFTIPLPGYAATIVDELVRYIDGTTPGSEIRGHITSISIEKVTRALIEAHRRGVKVYLVQDGWEVQDPPEKPFEGDNLHTYFGSRHKYCYFDLPPYQTKHDKGDLTSCVSSLPRATHHLKNWMFSNTIVDGVQRTYSTWVTSVSVRSLPHSVTQV